MRAVLAAAVALALAGCAASSGIPAPAAPPADGITQTTEQDGKFLALTGPKTQHAEPFLGIAGTNFWTLRSWVDRRNGETTHQLYVTESYIGAERKWNEAQDAAGKPLRFIAISRNEIVCESGQCSYVEEFAAAIPEEALRANPTGLTVFFRAVAGTSMAIPIPGPQIARQLAAVDAARASLPGAARAAPATSGPASITPAAAQR